MRQPHDVDDAGWAAVRRELEVAQWHRRTEHAQSGRGYTSRLFGRSWSLRRLLGDPDDPCWDEEPW